MKYPSNKNILRFLPDSLADDLIFLEPKKVPKYKGFNEENLYGFRKLNKRKRNAPAFKNDHRFQFAVSAEYQITNAPLFNKYER